MHGNWANPGSAKGSTILDCKQKTEYLCPGATMRYLWGGGEQSPVPDKRAKPGNGVKGMGGEKEN